MSATGAFIIVWLTRVSGAVITVAGACHLIYPWAHSGVQDLRGLMLILAATVDISYGEIVAFQVATITGAALKRGTPITSEEVGVVFAPTFTAARALRAIISAILGRGTGTKKRPDDRRDNGAKEPRDSGGTEGDKEPPDE